MLFLVIFQGFFRETNTPKFYNFLPLSSLFSLAKFFSTKSLKKSRNFSQKSAWKKIWLFTHKKSSFSSVRCVCVCCWGSAQWERRVGGESVCVSHSAEKIEKHSWVFPNFFFLFFFSKKILPQNISWWNWKSSAPREGEGERANTFPFSSFLWEKWVTLV